MFFLVHFGGLLVHFILVHYMFTELESVISIPCQICCWTSVGPLFEGTEELYNQMSVVWCISALVHAYVLFCIHIACGMWQFSLKVGMLWRAWAQRKEATQEFVHAEGTQRGGGGICSIAAMQERTVTQRRKQIAATDSFHPQRT